MRLRGSAGTIKALLEGDTVGYVYAVPQLPLGRKKLLLVEGIKSESQLVHASSKMTKEPHTDDEHSLVRVVPLFPRAESFATSVLAPHHTMLSSYIFLHYSLHVTIGVRRETYQMKLSA